MNEIAQHNAPLVLTRSNSIAELKTLRRPATEADLTILIGMLFVGRKARNGDDANSALTIKAYLLALSGQPLFAVRAAIAAYLQNRVPGAAKAFVPSCDELVAEVERQFLASVQVAPEMRRKQEEMPVQTSPLTDEQRERHEALMRRIKERLAMPADPTLEAEREDLRADMLAREQARFAEEASTIFARTEAERAARSAVE